MQNIVNYALTRLDLPENVRGFCIGHLDETHFAAYIPLLMSNIDTIKKPTSDPLPTKKEVSLSSNMIKNANFRVEFPKTVTTANYYKVGVHFEKNSIWQLPFVGSSVKLNINDGDIKDIDFENERVDASVPVRTLGSSPLRTWTPSDKGRVL